MPSSDLKAIGIYSTVRAVIARIQITEISIQVMRSVRLILGHYRSLISFPKVERTIGDMVE
jgi:hypothetical protein